MEVTMKSISFAILTLWAMPVAAAEPKFDAEAAGKKLAPFLDQQTLFVGRADTREFDPIALFKLVAPLVPPEAAATDFVKALRSALIRHGAWEIYVVYGVTDFPQPPCILVPIGESPPRRADLYELLKMAYGNEETASVNLHGFLCVGTKAGIERLKERKPSHRADLVEALAAGENAAVRCVFAPTAEVRKIYEEVVPTLPEGFGSEPIQTLTRGLTWASLSVGSGPTFEARFIVKGADEDSAKKLQRLLVKGLESGKGLLNAADSSERAAYSKFYERASLLLSPKLEKDRVVVFVDLGASLPELAKLIKGVQPAARTQSMNNLKQIGLALHNYADVYGHFPTDIKSKNGKPLLSWRVAILPYIEQTNLYNEFKQEEPWDGEHNMKLIGRMPKIFLSPKQGSKLKDRTTYLAPLGKGLMWDDPNGVKFKDVLDGTSNTILLVESDDEHATTWSKPDDIVIDMHSPAKGLTGHWEDGFLVLIADGSAQFVERTYSGIWAMFTKAGGEVLPEK
jgi:hypothetical protein